MGISGSHQPDYDGVGAVGRINILVYGIIHSLAWRELGFLGLSGGHPYLPASIGWVGRDVLLALVFIFPFQLEQSNTLFDNESHTLSSNILGFKVAITAFTSLSCSSIGTILNKESCASKSSKSASSKVSNASFFLPKRNKQALRQ